MEANGHDLRPEPSEERRKRLAKLLSRSNKALRDGIQLSEAITGDGAAIFRHACWMDLEGIVSKAPRLALRQRAHDELAEDEEPEFRAAVMPGFVSGLPTRIEGYRRRAEDARSKAENTRFGKTKASWLQLARLLGRAGRPASTSRANC